VLAKARAHREKMMLLLHVAKQNKEAESESQSASEDERESQSESESQSASEDERESQSESESQSASEDARESQSESESQSASEDERESQSESESQSASDDERESQSESKSQSASESESEPERTWRPIGKATQTTVNVQNRREICTFSLSADIAGAFIANFPKFATAVGVPPNTPVGLLKAASFSASEDGAEDEDHMQLRCDPNFRGGPWQDGLVLVNPPRANEAPGRRRKTNTKTLSGTVVEINPDSTRTIGILHFMFTLKDTLWLVVEALEGASRQPGSGKRTWNNAIIPNWPHLQTLTGSDGRSPLALTSRLKFYSLSAVERVCVIVEDPNHSNEHAGRKYWCPLHLDMAPEEEIFYDGSRYQSMESGGALDHDGSPLVSYAEATYMKPAELCPPLNLQHKPTRRRLKKFSEEKQ
jgi:hypothetical protein